MFSLEFLHEIRRVELTIVAEHLRPGARILELGGGTGLQAKLLSELGFDVYSIDIESSEYSDAAVYPVHEYDGRHIPLPDHSVDIVFSSNVLEHVEDLEQLQREVCRVLKPDGYCVHVLPTGVWRAWTNATHAIHHLQKLVDSVRDRRPARIIKHAVRAWIPSRHGETGNAITEIYAFSRWRWLRQFRRDGFVVSHAQPLGIFYTGYKVAGPRWSLSSRKAWAKRLGSAGMLYVLRRTSS